MLAAALTLGCGLASSAIAADDLLDSPPAKKDASKKDAPAKGGDALLEGPAPEKTGGGAKPITPKTDAEAAHAALYAQNEFPSAAQCATCHKQIYDEWASSNHAYASISPMFHKFEQRINDLAQGTIGYFCMRCHASVGTTLKEQRDMPLWERAPVSREGITCVTCHRVKIEFSKVNGERRIEQGDIHDPVYGISDGGGLAKVLEQKDFYKVKPSEEDKGPGVKIHAAAIQFEQLSRSDFCLSCHQVAVHPGIKLEVVWDQYRGSPAAKEGVTCQACHMGKTPGVNDGYNTGPVAVIAGKPIEPEREHHNHAFFGPGYPIAHPGIFPQNPRNTRFPIETWLKFDYRAGWGTEAFEHDVDTGKIKPTFPPEWANADDRYDAREIIEENLKKLEQKRDLRRQVMENGSKIDGPFMSGTPKAGKDLDFYYRVTNINPGHNLPSGSLGAQPELWINVALVDPDGKTVWESGYVDSFGDMCDVHSRDVRTGKIPHDDQLVNLQTKFLITNVKGTDREMYLPVNLDIDQLPFIRPAGQPTTVMNHPPFIRMESRSLPPLKDRKASYSVPGDVMAKPGKYKLAVRMRSRAEPIYFMAFCGATTEMEQAMNQWMINLHAYTVEFEVK
ncbi:MAG: cytochrome C [Planctomycetes bacterium]|nr:cytochrome C [Planctomycetota bacterium]